MTWRAYTDGSCEPNPGKGGWGAVLINPNGERSEIYGAVHEDTTTNNRAELLAIYVPP